MALRAVWLDEDREDKFVWMWEKNGCYSARSAYKAFFAGQTRAVGVKQIWRSRAPQGCRFFAWLVAKDRCWTGDRFLRRGLPHPAACPLCDQEPETLQHLLLGCVAARQIWSRVLAHWGRPGWVPDVGIPIMEWWTRLRAPKQEQRDLWTAINTCLLVYLETQKQRCLQW